MFLKAPTMNLRSDYLLSKCDEYRIILNIKQQEKLRFFKSYYWAILGTYHTGMVSRLCAFSHAAGGMLYVQTFYRIAYTPTVFHQCEQACV